jgi:pSer/pThr/pTyr-binding forkhead associated (FHA) protein
MQVRILVARGKAKQQQVKLELPVIVGRSSDVDLTINDPAVSRQHCELFEADGRVRVRDLGSTNGTRVGGKKVPEAVLRPHDRFTIGPFTLVVDYQDARDAATMQIEEDDAVSARPAIPSRRQSPPAPEPVSDWGESDDAAGLWDEPDLSGEPVTPGKPEAKPNDTSRAEPAASPPPAANPPRAKMPPQKISSATTTTASSGPDPELGVDLDELLEGLEGLDLQDFLKGIE